MVPMSGGSGERASHGPHTDSTPGPDEPDEPDEHPQGSRQVPCSVSMLAIIVTYRSRSTIVECLDSLLESVARCDLADAGRAGTSADGTIATAAGPVSLQVVVVDNASDDGTVQLVRQHAPAARVVALSDNVGFGRACKLAARQRFGPQIHPWDYILLVNPDTRLEPDCIPALLAAAGRRPRAGLYGGLSLRPDGDLDPTCCLARPTLWQAVCFATGASYRWRESRLWNPDSIGGFRRDHERAVPVLTASLLLMDAHAWLALDGFDDRYFLYGEDVDLCLRARRAGWVPRFIPGARYVHIGGASSTKADREVLILTGKATLYRSHLPAPLGALAVAALLAGASQPRQPANGARHASLDRTYV